MNYLKIEIGKKIISIEGELEEVNICSKFHIVMMIYSH